jgi:hypothetical protein
MSLHQSRNGSRHTRPQGVEPPDFTGYRRVLESYDIRYLNEMLSNLGRMRARTKAEAVRMIISNMEREAVHMKASAARGGGYDPEPYQGALH